jgi:hypothetical protein
MKKICFFLLMFCTVRAISQHKPEVRLNVYAGYVFDDHVESYYSNTSYYNGTVKGALKWGGGLEYMVHPAVGIELSYLLESTTAPTTYYETSEKSRDFDIDISYLMLGGIRYFPMNTSVESYFGFDLGAGFVNVSNPTTGTKSSSTKFAWEIKGGANIWTSEKVGIKLQANLVSLAQAAGGGIYFGTGGVSPGLSAYSSILQFSLGGGLVFRFGGITTTSNSTKGVNM